VIRRFLTEQIIGPQFIDPIAGKTLRRFKALAEAEAAATATAEGAA